MNDVLLKVLSITFAIAVAVAVLWIEPSILNIWIAFF